MKCCIIGHRSVLNSDVVVKELIQKISDLVENKNVTNFIFGNYGEFNTLAYDSLYNLKLNSYPYIKLISYSLKNECFYTFEEYSNLKNKNNKKFMVFDEIVYLWDIDETKFKYSQVLRNKKMIKDSDYCLFYYRENYNLANNRKSGTKIAFKYAKDLNKNVITI